MRVPDGGGEGEGGGGGGGGDNLGGGGGGEASQPERSRHRSPFPRLHYGDFVCNIVAPILHWKKHKVCAQFKYWNA